MGRWIGERLNQMEGPVRFLLPEGGVSALDAPGKPFYDPEGRRTRCSPRSSDTVRQTAQRQLDPAARTTSTTPPSPPPSSPPSASFTARRPARKREARR